MDKNFIKKEHLDEAVKRFNEIYAYNSPNQSKKNLYEYTFITTPQVNEDGDDDQQQNVNPQGGQEQQPQNLSPDVSNQMGNTNGQNNDEMPPEATQMSQSTIQQQPSDDMENVQPDNMEEPEVADDGIETQEMDDSGGDEVIDVDDLTQSQEATEYKIDGVDDRLSKLFAAVQKFSDQLDKNQEEILALKDEFEKRNPTEEEKLNIRSQSSYPYSETPKDYWENKVKENPHYDVMFNNEVSPSEEQNRFDIKKSDISGLNMKSISDTLNVSQNLHDYIGF